MRPETESSMPTVSLPPKRLGNGLLLLLAAILCLVLLAGCTDPIPESGPQSLESPDSVISDGGRRELRPEEIPFDAEVLRIVVLMADIELAYDSASLLLNGYVDGDHSGSRRGGAVGALEASQFRIAVLIQMLQGWRGQLFGEENSEGRLHRARAALLQQLRDFDRCLSVAVAENPVSDMLRCTNDVHGSIDAMYRALWSLPGERTNSNALYSSRSREGRLLIELHLINRHLLESCFVTACYGSAGSTSDDTDRPSTLLLAVSIAQTQIEAFSGVSVALRNEQCGASVVQAQQPMLRLLELWSEEMRRLWISRSEGRQLENGFRFGDNEIAQQAVMTYEDLLLSCLVG